MDRMIEGIEGVVKSMDDFLVFGETEEELIDKSDKVLQVMKDNGMTLKKDKCTFRAKEVEFLGYRISEEGICPIEEKVQAIKNCKIPRNITQLRSFMGMAQQLNKFTPN